MAVERKNIPLKGLFPLPKDLETAPVDIRGRFWKWLGSVALRLKRDEISEGVDRFGNKFLPVRRKWGEPTPLIPHGLSSRTYRLLTYNWSAQAATLYWRSGGGRESWPTILGYHAYKHGPRSLPVRNTIGLSPKSVRILEEQASVIWREIGPSPPPPSPKPKPKPKPRPREPRPKPPTPPPPPPVRLPAAEDFKLMEEEANRLTREAMEEARKIMEEARLEAIRKREAEEAEARRARARAARAEKKRKAAAPDLTGKPFMPGGSMKERLEGWSEGDKAVKAILERSREASELAKAELENKDRIIALMYSRANAQGTAYDKIGEEMERRIEAGKELRRKLDVAREKAFDGIINVVNIPASRRLEPTLNMKTFESTGNPEDVEAIRKAMERLGSITRNVPLHFTVNPLPPSGRAHYLPRNNSVNLRANESPWIAAHEMAHAIEAADPGIMEATKQFLKYRTGTEKFTDLGTLPKGGAMAGEMGRKDRFDKFYDDPDSVVDAYYAGKVYSDDTTEVFSMGVEALFRDPGKFAAKDPEWCKFILGVLSGELRAR